MLKRYGCIPELPASDFVDLANKAIEAEQAEQLRSEWCALYPHMLMGRLKLMEWQQYYDARTGSAIDTRPADEIIAEIEALHAGEY